MSCAQGFDEGSANRTTGNVLRAKYSFLRDGLLFDLVNGWRGSELRF
jgi:hypothetical protein